MPAARRPAAVAKVLERVRATSRKHELSLPGQIMLVAVSGGPDSICLVESLERLRRTLKVRIAVVHVDHGLRGDSADDATYVRNVAARLGLPFHLRELGLGVAPAGRSGEEWARQHRYKAFSDVMREIGAERVATAHTRDDNAETVLLRLLTGSGTTGVGGIRHREGPYVRPLLDVGRDEVEAFCRSLHLRPRLDPTNADPAYALRNRLRLEGIPALERALGRNVREPLARSAALLIADDLELTRQMYEVWNEIYGETADGIVLDAARLLEVPRVVAARLVGQAIFRLGRPVTRAAIEGVLDLAAGRPGRRRSLTHAVAARRERVYVRLFLAPSPAGASDRSAQEGSTA
jgi:tRNA(Ile)-lysidine synthase